MILENCYTVSRKREGERTFSSCVCVETSTSPPPLSPQQWMSGGVWLPSILRAAGVNSRRTPGICIEEAIELSAPPSGGPQEG